MKYLLYQFVSLFCILLSISLTGQDCDKTTNVFSATLDPSKTFISNDWGVEGLWNRDGEYVTLGIKDDGDNPNKFALYFQRFDATGSPLMAMEIFLPVNDYSFHQALLKTTHITEIIENGELTGYAIAATIRRFSLDATRVIIFRLDKDGCVAWTQERTVSNNPAGNEIARDIIQNSSGDLVVLISSSENSVLLTEISAGGSFSEVNEFRAGSDDLLPASLAEVSSAAFPNLQYLVTGSLNNAVFVLPVEFDYDVLGNQIKVIDVDENAATPEFAQTISGSVGEVAVISGYRQDANQNQTPFLIGLSLTAANDGSFGTIDFVRDYELDNLTNKQFALDMVTDERGNIYVGGYTFVQGTEPSSFIFKTNSNGNGLWAKNYEVAGESGYFISLANVPNQGIFGVGGKWNSLENRRIFMMKADSDGELCNCFSDINLSLNQFNSAVSLATTQILRPDWEFQFPSMECKDLNVPPRFCEQNIALGPEVEFILPKINIECDAASFCIDVKVKDFEEVNEAAFSFEWDPDLAAFSGATVISPGLSTGSSFNQSQVSSGRLGFSWKKSQDPDDGITLIDNATILEVCFDVVDNEVGIERFNFVNSPVARKVRVVNEENERFISTDGFFSNDCEKDCNSAFTVNLIDGCGEAQFTNQSISIGLINSILWNFGDGASSSDMNPVHFYDNSGDYTVELTVTDSEGCVDTYTEVIVVTIDNDAPTIFCPEAIFIECSNSREPENTGFAIAEDNCGEEGITLIFQDEFLLGNDCSSLIKRTWVASDQSGNVETCEQIINLVDRTGPIITNCIETITVNSNASNCSAQVTITTPSVSDECNPVSSFINDHTDSSDASGLYTAGTTLVTWTATDDCGNTSSCVTTVEVLDNIAPEVTCLDDIVLNANGEAGRNVTFADPMITDDCGASLQFSHESGSFFLCGTTTVSYFAVDEAGNASETCTFDVTIICAEADCCQSENVFNAKVDAGFSVAIDSNTIHLTPISLDNCHIISYDWGDGFTTSSLSGSSTVVHEFRFPGEYTILAQVQEQEEDGETCFQQVASLEVCIAFETCINAPVSLIRPYGFGSTGTDEATDVTVGPEGNIYLAGLLSGSVEFGGETRNSFGHTDAFLAKYEEETGNLLWVTQAGGASDDFAKSVATDNNGNVYLAGGFNSEEITLYSSPGSGGPAITLSNDNAICEEGAIGCRSDAFLAKYDQNGSLLWAFSIGEQEDDCISDLSIDQMGNLLVTGYFALDADFDPGAEEFTLNGGTRDIFVGKYSPDAVLQWAFQVGGSIPSLQDEGRGITTDPNNNVYVTGYFSGNNVDFDPAADRERLLSAGSTATEKDIFVARYDEDGDLIWAYDMGNTTTNRVNTGSRLTFDNNQLYLIGHFSGMGSTSFDPKSASAAGNLFALTDSDVFVASYRNNFDLNWAFNLGTDGMGADIQIGEEGNILITGSFANNFVDFDPVENQNALLPVSGSSDIFLAKYSAEGDYLSAINPSSTGMDIARGLAAGQDGNIYLAGSYADQGFIPDPSGNSPILANQGERDVFWGTYRCICPQSEECRTNCDFISVDYTFTDSDQDSCCFDLVLDNLASNYFTSLRLTAIGEASLQRAALTDEDWSTSQIGPDSIQLSPNSEFIATGINSPLAFCVNSAGGSPQQFQVELFDSDMLACVDTITIDCTPSMVAPCLEIVSDSSFCDGNDFLYRFTWQNNSDFEIATLGLYEITAPETMVDPLEITYDPVVTVDGDGNQGIATFRFTGLQPNIDPCMSLIIKDAEGQNFCVVEEVCLPSIGEACDLCEFVAPILEPASGPGNNSCCFSIDLANGYRDGFFRSIRTDLLDGLRFSSQETTLDWSFTNVPSLDTATWKPLNNSALDLDTIRSKVNFCLSGLSETGNNRLVVNWIDFSGEVACLDTLPLPCSAPFTDECIRVIDGFVSCSTQGDHELRLTIGNESGFAFDQIQVRNLSLTSPGITSDPMIPFDTSITIADGASSALPTIALNGAQAGDMVCLTIAGFETNGPNRVKGCYTRQLCYELPDCQSCACQPWSGLRAYDPTTQESLIGSLACGDTITLTDCNYQFCLSGTFGCSENDCDPQYSWKLVKRDAPDITVAADTISGTSIDHCFDLSPTAFPTGIAGPGVYDLQLNGQCGIRNCEDCSLVVEILCDATCAPEISCPDDIHLDCYGPAMLPSPTFSDTCGNRSFSCSRDDGMTMLAPFLRDTTCVTCIAQNSNGLRDTCAYKVIVDNTEQLAITCPDAIVVELPVGEMSTTVTFADPVISNDCNVVWECDFSSGDTFACGITPVTCIAIDTLLQDTVRCSFDVEVLCRRTTDCDSLITTYTRDDAEPDSCCYFITLNNNFDADRYTGINFSTNGQTTFTALTPAEGWTITRDEDAEAFTLRPPEKYIPQGDQGQVLRICTDNFNTVPHEVDLAWMEEVQDEMTALCPSVLEFACDTTKCCIGLDDFMARVDAVEIDAVFEECKVTVQATGLGPCDQIFYDWEGDGNALDGPYQNGETITHAYSRAGEYEVCYTIREVNRKGEVCWTPQTACLEEKVLCEDFCCIDRDDFRRRVASGYTYNLDNCKLTVTGNELNECNRVRWDWGDNSPISEETGPNEGSSHFFDGPGSYKVCMLVEESDENGQQCFPEEQFCMEFEIDCQPVCTCGAFENISFGQEPVAFSCGADPVVLDCPMQDLDFKLAANFGCEGNCAAEEVLLEIFKGDDMISSGSVPMNGNALEAGIDYSVLKSPGAYTIVLTSTCDDRTCSCEFQFVIEEECDCECGEFQGLIIDQNGTEFMPECNGDPLEIESCVEEDLLIKGFFACMGSSCSDDQLTWTLTTPAGTTISNVLPMGNFQLSFNSSLIEAEGDYSIEITGSCGVNSCTCSFVWTRPFCEPCPCPIGDSEPVLEQNCNKVEFLFEGLEECDEIKIDFGDDIGDIGRAGTPISHWYMEEGTYTVRYLIEREQSTGLRCSKTDSIQVEIACIEPMITEGNKVKNGSFIETNGATPRNWSLSDDMQATLRTNGDGCNSPNWVNLQPTPGNPTGETLLFQQGVDISAGHLYEIGLCLYVSRTLNLERLKRIPVFEMYVSTEPPGRIPDFTNCGETCTLIARTQQNLSRKNWKPMRFDNWTADKDYEFLIIRSASSVGIHPDLVTQLDNINVADLTTSSSFSRTGEEISIYPNPARERVIVEFSSPIQESLEIRLLNTLGQEMSRTEMGINSRKSSLELYTLTRGLYFLQVIDQNGNLRHFEKLVHH